MASDGEDARREARRGKAKAAVTAVAEDEDEEDEEPEDGDESVDEFELMDEEEDEPRGMATIETLPTHERELAMSLLQKYSQRDGDRAGLSELDFEGEDTLQDLMRTGGEGGVAGGAAGEGGGASARQRRKVTQKELEHLVIARRKKVIKGARGRRRVDELQPYLQPIMGHAIECFTNRDFAEAKKYLNELIRHAPKVARSYKMLALIAKEEGDTTRELQYLFFAAAFTSSDMEQWYEVAEMSREQGLLDQAITCYEKIRRSRRDDVTCLVNLARLYAQKEAFNKAISTYRRLLTLRPHDLATIVELARVYAQKGDEAQAVSLFEDAFASEGGHEHYGLEHVNYLAELYLTTGNAAKMIDLIDKEEEGRNEALPLDLVVKRTIGYIKLSREHELAAQDGLRMLEEFQDVAAVADLYQDVALAFVDRGMFERALRLYDRLVQLDEFNQPELWLRQAVCHLGLGNTEEAQRLADSVPDTQHMDERGTLAKAWQALEDAKASLHMPLPREASRRPAAHDAAERKRARHEHADDSGGEAGKSNVRRVVRTEKRAKATEAAQTSAQDRSNMIRREFGTMRALAATRPRDVRALLDVCTRLWKYFETDYRHLQPPSALDVTSSNDQASPSSNVAAAVPGDHALTLPQWLTVVTTLACMRLSVGEVDSAYNPLFEASNHSAFLRAEKLQADLRAALLVVCLSRDDVRAAVEHARWFCARRLDKHLGFNVFFSSFARVPDGAALVDAPTTVKYITRYAKLAHNNLAARLAPAHVFSKQRNVANSLEVYVNEWQSEPLLDTTNLLLGVKTLHQAMQRVSPNRHVQIAQGVAFMLRYYAARGGNQEANYNLGRAFQSLGLAYLAVPYYEAALQQEPLTAAQREGLSAKEVAAFDLRRETAWNLASVYMLSGNALAAADLVSRYLAVD